MTGGPWRAGTVVPGTEVPFCPPVLLVGWPASAAPPLPAGAFWTPPDDVELAVPPPPPQAAAATTIAMTTRTLFIWNGLLGVCCVTERLAVRHVTCRRAPGPWSRPRRRRASRAGPRPVHGRRP